MMSILVDQFKGNDFLDIYVNNNDLEEVYQGLSISEGYKKIKELKNKYNINKVVFKIYNENEQLVKTEISQGHKLEEKEFYEIINRFRK